ncbi:MAG TPA: FAD-dependent oxidoreductase, partial [Lachnospiraceae bacterium]|nr:FAD-dependent oxidoreductase [Lachnospiraceae bacterium]
KLPNVSFEETLISCLEKKAYGTQPGHAQFYYPKKYGYGELWSRMAKALGDRILYDTKVREIDFDKKTVNGQFQAEVIVITIPWNVFETYSGLPASYRQAIDTLKYSSVVIEYYPENLATKAHWIYYPDLQLSYHRILVRHNFCPGTDGYWTETNLTRFCPDKKEEGMYFINEYAYPLNTIGKQEKMAALLNWAETKQVYGLGRWGEWQHYNSDVVTALAIKKADDFCK